ncbi:Uncharacterized protein PHSC3_001643 [Chlamydiales bacterium STE3]|nr:Uncharacterized protein PHSC3_001643 [Chlamydiales bacterium STE3]
MLSEKAYFTEIRYVDELFSLSFFPLREEHAEAVLASLILSLNDLKPFMDWSHRELTLESQMGRMRLANKNFSKGISYDFAVFVSKSKEFLMSASLHASRVPNKKSLGIGYWTSSKHCNKGLATIATKVLVVVAFQFFGCDRVEIICNRANQKSIRVIEKCHFKFECEAKNYFSEPNQRMLSQGYNPERSARLYALVKEDIATLDWYTSVLKNITIV